MSILLSIKQSFARAANLWDQIKIGGCKAKIQNAERGILYLPTVPTLYGVTPTGFITLSSQEAADIRIRESQKIDAAIERQKGRIARCKLA